MTLGQRLEAELARLAAASETVTYGALAERLQVPSPGRIAQLTAALERTMREDAAWGRPLRAALCESRTGAGLPAPGFFHLAAELGLCPPAPDPAAAAAFVAAQRAALRRGD